MRPLPLIEPVYPLTEGLAHRSWCAGGVDALQLMPTALPEWQGRGVCGGEAWPASVRRCTPCTTRAGSGRPAAPARAAPGRSSLTTSCWRAQLALCAGAQPEPRRAAGPRTGRWHLREDRRHRAPCPAERTPSQGDGSTAHRGRPGLSRTACCGCCRATSAPARRWWRCSPAASRGRRPAGRRP